VSTEIITQWLNLSNIRVERVLTYDSHTDLILSREIKGLVCSRCGQVVEERYDHSTHRLRDLSVFELQTFLLLDKWRICCPKCGVRVEDLGFADPYARATRRFQDYVARLCQLLPLAAVAELLCLDWKTVKEIDKRALQERFKTPNYQGLRLLAVDELAYRKYRNYLTIVLDLERTAVVWAGRGRSQATLEAFFEEIGEEVAQGIEAIAMDMWDPYIAATRGCAPQAEIVFDKFHVIKNYSKVIDRVRIDEYRRAKEEGKEVLKGTRYLLLKNREKLSPREESRLDALLALNARINTVHILKEDLKRLWECEDRREANRLLIQWMQAAEESGIEPLQRFARTLDRYSYGLLSHCEHPITTGKLEGTNNKIKVLIRRSYGFHDLEYLILKIKQAAPFARPGTTSARARPP